MKKFVIKTILLIAMLCAALLYGIEVAKNHMMEMKGVSSESSALLDFNIPELSSHPAESNKKVSEKAVESASNQKLATSSSSKPQTIEERVERLNKIDTFNPFSALGDQVGKGVSGVFKRGMEATTNMFEGIIKVIL